MPTCSQIWEDWLQTSTLVSLKTLGLSITILVLCLHVSFAITLPTRYLDDSPVGILLLIWNTLVVGGMVVGCSLFYVTKPTDRTVLQRFFASAIISIILSVVIEFVYLILGSVPQWNVYASDDRDMGLFLSSVVQTFILMIGSYLFYQDYKEEISFDSRIFNVRTSY